MAGGWPLARLEECFRLSDLRSRVTMRYYSKLTVAVLVPVKGRNITPKPIVDMVHDTNKLKYR
jgi:hypothetical protein